MESMWTLGEGVRLPAAMRAYTVSSGADGADGADGGGGDGGGEGGGGDSEKSQTHFQIDEP